MNSGNTKLPRTRKEFSITQHNSYVEGYEAGMKAERAAKQAKYKQFQQDKEAREAKISALKAASQALEAMGHIIDNLHGNLS